MYEMCSKMKVRYVFLFPSYQFEELDQRCDLFRIQSSLVCTLIRSSLLRKTRLSPFITPATVHSVPFLM